MEVNTPDPTIPVTSSYLYHIHYLPSIIPFHNLPPDCYSCSLHTDHYISLVAFLFPLSPSSSASSYSFPWPRAPRKSHVFSKWTGWEIEAGLLCLSSHSSVTLLLFPSGGPSKLVTAATTMQHACSLFCVHIHTHSIAPWPV